MQALHAKKLEQALRSHERFPVNLEWMVDVFKYKHISSLTTHLKRHFKMNVHYKRFAQEQNKRVWTYFISVDCFIGICEYVRHAARKKIANLWLRKVGVKGNSKRQSREYDFSATSEDEEGEEEGEEEAEGEYEFYQDEDDDEEAPPTVRRRRRDDDEEFRIEDDGDDSDRSFFTQDGEEEDNDDSSSFPADSEDDGSMIDYDSSSSSNFDTPPLRHRVAALTVSGGFSPTTFSRTHSNPSISYSPGSPNIANYRSLSFSGASSSGASSPSSSPSSPISQRVPRMSRTQQNVAYNAHFGNVVAGNFTPPKAAHPLSGSAGLSRPMQNMGFTSSLSPSPSTAPPQPFASSPVPLPSAAPVPIPPTSAPTFVLPSNPLPIPSNPAVPVKQEPIAEVSTPTEQVDWSYLMLRPSPSPPAPASVNDLSGKFLTSLLMSSAFYQSPQQQFVNSFGTNGYYPTANLHHPIHAHAHGMESVHGFPGSTEPFGDLPGLPHMDDLAFDTNVFLS
jgi:hypothetical protein